MKEIVFVTHNKGKVKSAQKYFKDLKISTFDFELDEIRSEDLTKIAEAKVKQAYDIVNKPCIALDSGFFIDALNGFPKTFVNFALDTIGVDGILKLMEGKEDRRCCFKECLAYFDGKQVKYFYGISKGTLSKEKIGDDKDTKWSDLWYIFIPKNFNETMDQMSEEKRLLSKNIDGSTQAMEQFAKWTIDNL